MTAVKVSGRILATYEYASGLRTSKTVNGVVHNYYYASGKLLRETYGSNVLDFFYDQNGQPFAFKHNGTLYYYITNLQGDVIFVLDGSGATVASYKYDPYGNIVSATGTMAEINPLRYRGYYFDQETDLYYLQSRYYDPAIGRFINADALVSTGTGVLGYNMFAYCNNNPVNALDPDGHAIMYISIRDDLMLNMFFGGGGGGGGSFAFAGFSAAKDDIKKFEDFVTNESEAKALQDVKEHGVAFYKGVLIIRTPFDASFSFGFIGMSEHQVNLDTLKHEYGHTVQMKNKGLLRFTTEVAIPSITINILHRKGKLKYDYYGAPWEAEADMLGGVNRTSNNTPWPAGVYNSYWDLIKMFWE